VRSWAASLRDPNPCPSFLCSPRQTFGTGQLELSVQALAHYRHSLGCVSWLGIQGRDPAVVRHKFPISHFPFPHPISRPPPPPTQFPNLKIGVTAQRPLPARSSKAQPSRRGASPPTLGPMAGEHDIDHLSIESFPMLAHLRLLVPLFFVWCWAN
jgi:hypothetical protein